jgi:hypothetical protein
VHESYVIGEIVDITVKGVRIVAVDVDGHQISWEATNAADPVWGGYANLEDPSVTVERCKPHSWPPHVGDTWLDETGMAWFAFEPTWSVARRGGLAMAPAVAPTAATKLPTPEQLLAAHPRLTLANRVCDDDTLAGLIPVGHHPRQSTDSSTVEQS